MTVKRTTVPATTTGSKASFWFWAVLVGIVGLSGLRSSILYRQSEAESAAYPAESVAADHAERSNSGHDVTVLELRRESPAAEAAPVQVAGPRALRVVVDTIGADDSIYLSLKRHGVAESQMVLLNTAIIGSFDAKNESRPGDDYIISLDAEGAVVAFEYRPYARPERPLLVERVGERLVAQRLLLPLDRRLFAIEIGIEDNLSNSISDAGESDVLTDLLADVIFGSAIDFRKDPRKGDRIGLVFEKLYKDERFVRYDRVLLAKYDGQVVSRVAVHYEDPEGVGGYYDESGKSLERMFLYYPLSFRRISSNFTTKRFHPILKRNVPHLGIDYAANTGTVVWATARGRVAFAGRKGGYGKMVEIEHANGYRTRYAHLSRIQVRKGQRVEKQQSIGRVGTTGRSTGPHLHYELLKNGRHMNPRAVNTGREGKPVNDAYASSFAAHRNELFALVENAVPVNRLVADRR